MNSQNYQFTPPYPNQNYQPYQPGMNMDPNIPNNQTYFDPEEESYIENIIRLNRFNSVSQSDLNLADKILQKIAQKEYSGLIRLNTR